MRRTRVLTLVLAGLLALATWLVGFQTPPGLRSARTFDAERLADLETRMWQHYYQGENAALFADLVRALREQFRYPWSRALRAAFHLARAASAFARERGDYQRVLPDLTRAYAISRDWTGDTFDPAQVARAELAWWVARREPGQNDPQNVGRLIGVLYARFYQLPEQRVRQAGVLRARAADLRDRGGTQPDWREVSRLLHESYRSLHAAVAPGG
jgi:hypothetical protein